RRIEPSKAKEIVNNLPRSLKTVGVFVTETKTNIAKIAQAVGLDYIQLHGDETAEFARELSLPVIKAININDTLIVYLKQVAATYSNSASAGKIHLGGSGETFVWNAVTQTTINVSNVFLAGGLNETNVNLAIQTVSPIGIDVSSGVESNETKDDLEN